jgi:hypothetical protein
VGFQLIIGEWHFIYAQLQFHFKQMSQVHFKLFVEMAATPRREGELPPLFFHFSIWNRSELLTNVFFNSLKCYRRNSVDGEDSRFSWTTLFHTWRQVLTVNTQLMIYVFTERVPLRCQAKVNLRNH